MSFFVIFELIKYFLIYYIMIIYQPYPKHCEIFYWNPVVETIVIFLLLFFFLIITSITFLAFKKQDKYKKLNLYLRLFYKNLILFLILASILIIIFPVNYFYFDNLIYLNFLFVPLFFIFSFFMNKDYKKINLFFILFFIFISILSPYIIYKIRECAIWLVMYN